MRYACLTFIGSLTVLQLCSVTQAASVIYKTVESDGTVVFSDQKVPDATVVKSSPLNVVETTGSATFAGAPDSIPATDPQNSSTQNTELAAPEPASITQVKFKSLVNGQKLLNPPIPVMVEIETTPASEVLPPLIAHLLVNGKLVTTSQSSTLPLNELPRGTHSLQVNIIDEEGEVMAASESIEIHVTRPIDKASAQ